MITQPFCRPELSSILSAAKTQTPSLRRSGDFSSFLGSSSEAVPLKERYDLTQPSGGETETEGLHQHDVAT